MRQIVYYRHYEKIKFLFTFFYISWIIKTEMLILSLYYLCKIINLYVYNTLIRNSIFKLTYLIKKTYRRLIIYNY